MLKYTNKLRRQTGKNIILCGDFNAAHTEIDLARPKENVNNAGFSPEEREYISELIRHGYIDTFREFNKSPGNYTWWSYMFKAREHNIGWRIDYIFINNKFRDALKSAFILREVMGSDHAPVGITLNTFVKNT